MRFREFVFWSGDSGHTIGLFADRLSCVSFLDSVVVGDTAAFLLFARASLAASIAFRSRPGKLSSPGAGGSNKLGFLGLIGAEPATDVESPACLCLARCVELCRWAPSPGVWQVSRAPEGLTTGLSRSSSSESLMRFTTFAFDCLTYSRDSAIALVKLASSSLSYCDMTAASSRAKISPVQFSVLENVSISIDRLG